MQWNLQDKVDLKRFLKEQDQCCQWLVKWSSALVRLLSRNRYALGQMRGLWYSLFRASGYQNFSASWPRFFVHNGWSNSSRDTDPSAVSSLSCLSWLCLWCSFPLGFLVPNAWNWLVDDSKVKWNAYLHFAWSLLQISFEQHDGHLSSFPVANILGVTSLVFTLSPTCLVSVVSVGPLANVRNSFPSLSRCKVKSSTFIWWCSCRPRRPKCWVSSNHMVLSRARGVPPPSWPSCQRTSSSFFVKLLDRFGRFPLPCSRIFLAFPSRIFLELRDSISRMMDFG